MKKSRGFTLIELLVVIAIIGILAGIVLVNVNKTRSKAADTAVKGNLDQVRSTAEMLYDDTSPNSYSTLCDSSSNSLNTALTDYSLDRIEDDIVKNDNGGTPTTCYADTTNGEKYCVSAPLKGSGGADYWCVDNSGFSGKTSGDTCDGTDYDCK